MDNKVQERGDLFNLIFLLSTDWFFDYWQLVELDAKREKRRDLQLHCRKIVENTLNEIPAAADDEYWITDLSDGRITKTLQLFLHAVDQSGLDESFTATVRDILSGQMAADSDVRAAWILEQLTDRLIGDPDAPGRESLGPEVIQMVSSVRNKSSQAEVDLRSLDLGSDSDWDKFIRGITRSQPTVLSDYAREGITRPREFARLLKYLVKSMRPPDRAALIKWYVSRATEMTGEPFRPPRWLT
jgi:hypothetical protein